MTTGEFFNEFVVRVTSSPASINKALAEKGIVGGLDLGKYDENLANHMLWCATELNDQAAIDRLVSALKAVLGELCRVPRRVPRVPLLYS